MERLAEPDGRDGRALPPPAPQGGFFDSTHADPDHLVWLWSVILKRRLVILLAVVAAALPTGLYVLLAKPLYRSSVTLQVNPEAAKVLPYRDVSESFANGIPNFDLYMKTQVELLRGSVLQARVIERLKKERTSARPADWERQLGGKPQIARVEGSQIISLSYVASDPVLAAAAANAWADEFVRLHLELRSQTSRKAAEFLQHQLKTLKAKVEEAEEDLINYARSHQILNIDNKQENVIRQRFGYFNSELARSEKNFISAKAEYDGLQAVTLEDFPESLKDPAITSLEDRGFAAEQELTRLLVQFDEKWPAVVQKKRELALVTTQLTRAKRDALARARKQTEMKFKAAQDEYRMLKKALSEQAALVNRLNQASVDYNSLKRDFEASEQLYQGLLQRLKETGVSAGLEFGNIQIADRARPEKRPYRPRPAMTMVLALVFGLTLGVGLSVGGEYLDRTIKDPWAVERLGVPLLGWVPKAALGHTGTVPQDGGGGSRLLLAAPTGSRGEGKQLTKSQLRAQESYRALCVSILLSQPGGPPRVLLLTSAAPREGKTTTAAGLGIAFAEMGLPTLLIDGDYRSQALSRSFGLDRPVGLTTHLAGGIVTIEDTPVPNLSLLPAGTAPPNGPALLNSRRFEETLELLLEKYKFVIIDGPPVLSVVDASILASKVRGVVLVVNAESTPKDVVQKALAQIRRAGATVIGCAVNQVDLRKPEYYGCAKYYYDDRYLAGTTSK